MLHSSHARPPGLPPAPPGAHASLQHRVASWPTCRGCPSRPAPSSAAAGITRVTARAVFCHCLQTVYPAARPVVARSCAAFARACTMPILLIVQSAAACTHTLPHAYSALRLRSPACCRPPRPPALAAGVSDTQRRCVYDDCPRVQCPGPQPLSAGAERRPVALGSAGWSDGATDRSLSYRTCFIIHIRAPPRPPGAGRTPASPHGRRRRPRRTAHAARAKYTIKCGTSDICDNKSAHLGCEAPQLSHLQSGHTSHSSLTSPTVISLSHHTTHKQRAQALAPQSELPPVRAPRRGPAAARERAAHPVLDASRGSPIPNDDVEGDMGRLGWLNRGRDL